WTGNEMIVWGGADMFNFLKSGARYNPGTDTWVATSTTNAPDPRAAHTAVWTGGERTVWGGAATAFTSTAAVVTIRAQTVGPQPAQPMRRPGEELTPQFGR